MYYCSSLAVGPCLAATARAYLVEAVGVEAGFEKEGQPYAVSATGARAQRRRGAWDKSWSGPIHVATLSSRDTCEWFFSGGRCRAASRSGPARAREHGMSRVGGGWSLTMRAWATAAHWLEANPKASINVASSRDRLKASDPAYAQYVARVANRPDAAGQQPAVGVAKALLPHRRRWCASRFSRGRAALRCTCTERIQDVISAICHVRVNADAVKPSPEVWRLARPRGGKL